MKDSLCETDVVRRFRRMTLFGLGLIFLLSLGLKLLTLRMDPGISRDGITYVRHVQEWCATGILPAETEKMSWLPFYPFGMKCLVHCGLSAETAGRLISLLLGSLLPVIGFGIAWEVTRDRTVSLCSALLLAVHPSLNELSIEIQRDACYLFFIGAAVWCLLAGLRRERFRFWIAAGVLTAAAMQTRFETAEILLLLPFALIFPAAGGHLSWKKSGSFFLIFALSFAASFAALAELTGTREFLNRKYVQYYAKKAEEAKTQIAPSDGKGPAAP